MTSDDIYVRKDVYEADQRALRNEIKAGNQEILRALEQFESKVNSRLDKFEGEVNSRIDKFENEVNNRFGEVNSRIDKFEGEVNSRFGEVNSRFGEVNGRFNKFEGEVNGRFDKVEARFDVLTGRVATVEQIVERFDRRIDRIEDYVGTGIAFIAMLVAVVVFIEPIARFVKKIFKPEPTITIEQIEALIDAKLQNRS